MNIMDIQLIQINRAVRKTLLNEMTRRSLQALHRNKDPLVVTSGFIQQNKELELLKSIAHQMF